MAPTRDFDLVALYEALDAERRALGESWAQVAREVSGHVGRASTSRPVSASTITGIRHRKVAEGDGVLQMLRWLGRAPEEFVPGATVDDQVTALPEADSDQVLRWDSAALHRAVDERRTARGMSWRQVAGEVGCGPSALTALARGGRVHFPLVMRIVGWVDRPAAAFIRPTPP